jgi:hypothetical protein
MQRDHGLKRHLMARPELMGGNVLGQGGAGSPGSGGASPYRAAAREHADTPIRRYVPLPLPLSLADS